MSKTIGNFEVYAATGGYPVWCTIQYTNKEFCMSHTDLRDLKYAVEELMRSARAALPDQNKDEV